MDNKDSFLARLESGQDVKLTSHPHLNLRLTMRGIISVSMKVMPPIFSQKL
jgi:hypothetical protein